ncbi:MAG: condensation domain-containing protein [Acidimicrobiales bacterium]
MTEVRDEAQRAPAAVSQEGMAWHEYFVPGSFSLPCLVRRYEGRLDLDAFRWAVTELVRRHEPLRTTFEVVGGSLCLKVAAAGAPVEVMDLSDLPLAARDAQVARLLADATARPFDLGRGPLFEPQLIRLGREDHLFVVRLHHTAFDDWSVDLFRRELSALYAAGLDGAPSPLGEPAVTFTEVARRRRARLDGPDGAAHRDWWREELGGAPLTVQLPVGRPGPDDPGGPLRVDLPSELAVSVQALAPTLRATPYMTVLAAFAVLVSRWTGQEDLVLATVTAHRDRSELEPLIGCFTKKVPLRLRLDGDPTFAGLVARARRCLLAALAHQDVAFEAALQEGLGGAAAAHGVVPQVSVVFQAEAPQRVRLALPGLRTGPYEAPATARRERHFSAGTGGASPTWGDGAYLGSFLILSLQQSGDGMALIARGTFHRPTAARLLDQLLALLADVAADPGRPLSVLAPPPPPPPGEGVLDLRGFRVSRSRLEAAIGTCPGVQSVTLAVEAGGPSGAEPRLVAHVVAAPGQRPTLDDLRRAQWATLPGTPWPAALAFSEPSGPDSGPEGSESGDDDGLARRLAELWGRVRGQPAGMDESYWQDFSFPEVVAAARQEGLALDDEDVVRCRTPRVLAAAAVARSART